MLQAMDSSPNVYPWRLGTRIRQVFAGQPWGWPQQHPAVCGRGGAEASRRWDGGRVGGGGGAGGRPRVRWRRLGMLLSSDLSIQPATICLPRSIQTKRNHSKSPSLHYLDHTPQLRERAYEFGQNSLLMYYNYMNEIENQPILTCFSIDLNQKKKKKPRNITGIGIDFSAAL